MIVDTVNSDDYEKLIEIWESSVRETHTFLNEEDILFLKPLIREQCFELVDLRCAKDDDGEILGFIGVADVKIEMLFILPSERRKGVGKFLINYAINN